jgi:hypothetical protein
MTYVRPLVDTGQRVTSWFSCGDASAVASLLALRKYGPERVVIVRIRLDGEHPDNDRFVADCVRWFNHPVVELQAERYKDHWGVVEGERFINGAQGAKCTAVLKREVREAYQQFDDIQVFGFTAEERQRAQEFREHHGEVMLATPLIDEGMSKDDCHALVAQAGIELPAMYRLGYPNNNCIGCVKGGMGYWNKIRKDFPEAFDRMAKLERTLGRSCIGGGGRPRVFLDELDPKRGRLAAEPKMECGITCFSTAKKLA